MSRTLFLPAASSIAMAGIWTRSAALVAALHLGVAGLATARLVMVHADDALAGAELALEFAPVVSSAESQFAPEAQDRDSDDRQATPHLDETLSKKRELELPTEQASPTTPVEDDLKMAQEATRKESETATELQTTEAMVEQKQDVASQASMAAEGAPEQVGKPDDAVAAAPSEGNAAEARRQIEDWQRRIFAEIVRHKRYPDEARTRRLTGETVLAFRLDRQGQVMNLRILHSSGSPVLDKAAMAVLERANPLPRPPGHLPDRALDLTLPMRFAAK